MRLLKILVIVFCGLMLTHCGRHGRSSTSHRSTSFSTNGMGLSPFSYMDADSRQQDLWAELTGESPANDTTTGGTTSNSPAVSNASCGNATACAMTDAINDVRQSRGLSALAIDGACQLAAQAHAEDMALFNYLDHYGRDGSSPVTRAARYGATSYRIAENIAYSTSSIDLTVSLWMNSAPHLANILESSMTHTGVGAAVRGDQVFWVQCFMAK